MMNIARKVPEFSAGWLFSKVFTSRVRAAGFDLKSYHKGNCKLGNIGLLFHVANLTVNHFLPKIKKGVKINSVYTR